MKTILESLNARLSQIVYRPRDFVGRKKESGVVHKMLEEAWAKTLVTPFLILFGVHGIGKSWLIEHLGVLYAFSADRWQEMGNASLSVVVKADAYGETDGLLSILIAIVKGLDSGLGHAAVELGIDQQLKSLSQESPASLSTLQVQDKFDELVDLLGQLCDKRIVPVLLFDSVEQLSKLMLDNLIDWLVKPLILRPDILFVFAARGRFELKDLKVHKRCLAYQLEPFTRDEIEDKIKTRGNGLLLEPVEDFSYGHPLTVEAVCECARLITEQDRLPMSDVFERKTEEIAQVLDAAIVQDKFMQGLNDEQQKLLEAVCILRKFNPMSLKRFAAKFVDEKYAQESTAFYLRVLGDLVDSKLVEWTRVARAHVLDNVVRHMMSHNLRVRDLEGFRARHQEAADMYGRMMTESPAQGGLFILERLYHLACLSSISKETIEDEIGRIVQADKLDVDQVFNLKKEFCGDENIPGDVELRHLLGSDICHILDERLDKLMSS
jgi:hypothetical protein